MRQLVIYVRIWTMKQYPAPRLTGLVKYWPKKQKKRMKYIVTMIDFNDVFSLSNKYFIFVHKLIYWFSIKKTLHFTSYIWWLIAFWLGNAKSIQLEASLTALLCL